MKKRRLHCLMFFGLYNTYDAFLQASHAVHIASLFLLAACTGELQPLSLKVNNDFKQGMKENFSYSYANKIRDQLDVIPNSAVNKTEDTTDASNGIYSVKVI